MRSERIQLLKDINTMFSASSFVYMVSYKGLKVADLLELRKQLAQKNAQCHIIKNSYIRKSAESLGWVALSTAKLEGDTAVIVGSDCSGAAKVIKEFAKTNAAMAVKMGQMDGQLLSSSDIEQLADLPSLDQMRSILLGVLEAPKRNLVGVLNQKVSTVAFVLQAILDKKN